MSDLLGDMLNGRGETMDAWVKVNSNESQSQSSVKETWRDFGWPVGFQGYPKSDLLVKEIKTGEVFSISMISESTITLIDGTIIRLAESFLGKSPEFALLSAAQEPLELDMTEGIVPDPKDNEETTIKKLDEAPIVDKPRKLGSGGKSSNPGDEKDDALEDEAGLDDEDDFTAPSADPGMDAEEELEPVVDEPKTGDIEKEYLGKLDDTHYYFVTEMGDEDTVEDMQVVDQEGAIQFSAKEKGIEITEDPADFIKVVYQELDIEDIARDVFLKYLLPKMEQENEQEEEEGLDVALEDPEEDVDVFGEEPEEKSKGVPPLEGFTIQFKGKGFHIREAKKGLYIQENFFEFSQELMDLYKKEHGMRDLALSTIHALDEEKIQVLLEYDIGTGGDRKDVTAEDMQSGTFEVIFNNGDKVIVRGAQNRQDALKKSLSQSEGKPTQVDPIDDPGPNEGKDELVWKSYSHKDANVLSPEASRKKAVAKQTSDIAKKAGVKERELTPEEEKGLDDQLVDPKPEGMLAKAKRLLHNPDVSKQLQKEDPVDMTDKPALDEEGNTDYATLPKEYLEKILRIMKASDHSMTPDHDEIVAQLEAALAGGDQMPEGVADTAGTTDADVDPEQLKMGVAVEMEHTANKEYSKKIAMEHLAEDPEYYTKLKQMESE